MTGVEEARDPSRTARRRCLRAGAIGALLAVAVFVLVLLDGHASLLRRDPIGHFYDLQAHSLLHGRWDVPAGPLGIEAFVIRGKAFTYYGPWPALLRMPIVALTSRLDGRLTQLSMLAAFGVAMVFTVQLTWRVRVLARGDAIVNRAEPWVVGGFTFVVGAGSVLLFLGSRAFVYHEAELWGAALALGAFSYLVTFISAPTGRDLVAASSLATLAFLSRASVGAGPVAALALLLVASLWGRTRRAVGLRGTGSEGTTRPTPPPAPMGSTLRRLPASLAIATAVPVALYAWVNESKFGTLFSLPLGKQVFSRFYPARRAALAANGGSLFGLKFVPTTLVQFLRPDALRLDRLVPWVTFPPPADVIGHVRFDTLDLSSSIPASMPLLAVLAIVGLIGVARPLANGGATLAVLRVPLLGAAVGAFVTLTIAFVAERYLSDFLPGLVLAAAAGVHVVLRWSAARPRASNSVRLVWTGLAVLTALSVWFNASLAVLYQRQLNPGVSEAELAAFVRFQYHVHDRVPGGNAPYVRHGDHLPRTPLARGIVFVVGDCEGLYWSSGDAWRALERTATTGRTRLQVEFPDTTDGARQPLVVSGRPGQGNFITVRQLPGHRVVFGYYAEGLERRWQEGGARRIRPGRAYDVDIADDTLSSQVNVKLDGGLAFSTFGLIRPTDDATIGRTTIGGPVAPRFTGRLRELPIRPTMCRALTG